MRCFQSFPVIFDFEIEIFNLKIFCKNQIYIVFRCPSFDFDGTNLFFSITFEKLIFMSKNKSTFLTFLPQKKNLKKYDSLLF